MKCALVTGGSRGIGRAICLRMASLGYYVLVNYKSNAKEANNTLSQITEAGGNGELLQFDVADRNQVRHVLGGWIEANDDNKYIEVLVNNAGIRDDSLMAWMSEEQWDNVLKTNLDSFFVVTRLVLNSMLGRKYGRIINVVSLSGIKGLAGQTNYSAAKAGVIGATKAAALEYAQKGLRVNAVCPAVIRTPLSEGLFGSDQEAKLLAVHPMGRFGTTEEVADAVVFLCSNKASYITGHSLPVDAGLLAR